MATTTTHDPEHLDAQADTLERELAAQRARAQELRDEIEQNRHAAARAYWTDQISRFYEEERDRADAAWQEFTDALIAGEGARALDLWFAYRRIAGELRRRHQVLASRGKEFGIPGMRPGLVTPRARTFAEAMDLAADQVGRNGAKEVEDALLQAEAAAADSAEQTTRAGRKPNTKDKDRAPVAVFAYPKHPNGIVTLPQTKVSVTFRDGDAAAYTQEEADALRKAAHLGIEEKKEDRRR